MKTNHITKLVVIFILTLSFVSCNEDNTEYNYTNSSADAQIYSFSISATPTNAIDSITYPIMAKTLFTIDQSANLIYNHDSLPYGTKIGRFATTLGFGPNSVGYVEVIYPNDSIVTWKTSDSINYSLNPKLKVWAQNRTASREYTVDIRVHKIDPDTIIWTNTNTNGSSLNLPSGVGLLKTILFNDKFYCYSLNAGNISLYTTNRNSVNWTKETSFSGLDSSIALESITLYNNSFYAVDNSGNGYKSTNGISWSSLGNKNAYNILGIVPSENEANDILLLLTKNGADYYISQTNANMASVTTVEKVSSDFPVKGGFTSATKYNRTDNDRNILVLEGGLNASSSVSKSVWLFKNSSKGVQATSSIIKPNFEVKEGLSIFVYNDLLYALESNQLYTSSWGYEWVKAPEKETLATDMPKASKQSVVVDKENNIWILGGLLDNNSTYTNQVWKGRLNKLIP